MENVRCYNFDERRETAEIRGGNRVLWCDVKDCLAFDFDLICPWFFCCIQKSRQGRERRGDERMKGKEERGETKREEVRVKRRSEKREKIGGDN